MHRVLLVALMLAACGGSGVDSDKLIVELSETEIDDVCTYILAEQGGARTEQCEDEEGNAFTVEFYDFDGCVDSLLSYSEECPATVRQEEECAEKLGVDPCDDPAACHAADDC
ncbi:MAG: hypothetical protein ACKV2T_15545 [Kofleriaceae bacterium]